MNTFLVAISTETGLLHSENQEIIKYKLLGKIF